MVFKKVSNRGWILRASALVLVLLVAAGVGAGWYLERNGVLGDRREVCADFTDAVGVYTGNTVSMMGIPVGNIKEITPRNGGVRMVLNVDKKVQLSADVGAVVIDSSIVTDRRIEFTSAYTSGPTLSTGACIPVNRTRTPRGISETFTSTSNLLGDLLGSDLVSSQSGSKPTNEVGELVAAADAAVSKRGQQINDMMRSFVHLQGDAPETDAVLRRLVENSETMTTTANERWPEVSTLVQTVNDAILAFTYFSEEFSKDLVTAISFLPPLARMAGQVGDRLIVILKFLGPWVQTLAPHATSLADIIAKLPGLSTATDQIFDKKTGAIRVMWKPPSFDLRGADVAGVCRALDKPAGCIVDSSNVGLVQLMLGRAR
ncbi:MULTISPECIES: MlaD family protein [Tsukamurella]|uniref:MlaD family protein n=1 Tax=Tsukamurella TaxID=2060 RepID=UPI002DD44671|nr:MlaD family protein [Tsukamurella tyrosinosolvens]MEC4616360.1 MlaD family protein [Tsukamurella tyrosinosolvens]